jgi:hypothetical protein
MTSVSPGFSSIDRKGHVDDPAITSARSFDDTWRSASDLEHGGRRRGSDAGHAIPATAPCDVVQGNRVCLGRDTVLTRPIEAGLRFGALWKYELMRKAGPRIATAARVIGGRFCVKTVSICFRPHFRLHDIVTAVRLDDAMDAAHVAAASDATTPTRTRLCPSRPNTSR